jgi:hypothetical protein
MFGIAAFHILMLILGLSILTRALPPQRVGSILGYLHNSIGITTPPPAQARTVALIWIGSVVVIVDGCLFLLVFVASMSNAR